MVQLIDGKKIAAEIRSEIKREVEELKTQGVTPGLAVILVGEDPASCIYVKNKHQACSQVGIYSEVYRLPQETSQKELLQLIHQLNKAENIHGILVQLPVPKHIKEKAIIDAIALEKDVDGFSPTNVGKLVLGDDCFYPCTPYGCMVMMEKAGIKLEGKRAVVVGRSNIVGKPVSIMLMAKHATVTTCHSLTRNLAEECRRADVLIVAVGQPQVITAEMVKEGAVVIDVGMNRLENGALVGDVDFASVSKKAGWLTPVPGGVGPMTITMLLKNTLKAAQRRS